MYPSGGIGTNGVDWLLAAGDATRFRLEETATPVHSARKRGVDPPTKRSTSAHIGNRIRGYSPCFRKVAGQVSKADRPKTGAVPGTVGSAQHSPLGRGGVDSPK